MLSGSGLCVGLITSPEGPNECGVSGGDSKASIMGRSGPTGGCCAAKKKFRTFYSIICVIVAWLNVEY
jgi:hypothetical protein